MRRFTLSVLAALGLSLLAACGAGDKAAWRGAPPADPTGEADYLKPPRLASATVQPGGALSLIGRSEPGSRVHLTGMAGENLFATADASGAWQTALPGAATLRLYGLSMTDEGRTLQSEGFVAVAPEGLAAQLRAGAGAVVVGVGSDQPRILAVDFDRDGAAVVSGVAKPGAGLQIRIDRTAAGDVKTAANGRFALTLSTSLSPGAHRVDIAGEGGEDAVDITAGRSGPIGQSFVATRNAGGWRIDWTTPAGGVQTTLLLSRPGVDG